VGHTSSVVCHDFDHFSVSARTVRLTLNSA
jgi:hypothetical protein